MGSHLGIWMGGHHFRVTTAAHAVTDLPLQSRVGGRNERSNAQEQADATQTPIDIFHL
jgi:hypothetical protein